LFFKGTINMKQLHRLISAFIAGLFIMIIGVGVSTAQQGGKKYLLALSKTDHTLAIVDPVTLKVLSRIPVGEDPHEVVASTDGKIAYVAIYGGGAFHELNVIDLVNRKPLPNIDTRPLFGPHDVTYVQGKVWFTAEGSKAVGRYDPVTQKLDWSLGTGQDRTHMIYVSPDAKRIYTTNISSGTVIISSLSTGDVFIYETATKKQVKQLKLGKGCAGILMDPDGSRVFIACSADNRIAIIDLKTLEVTSHLDVGGNPDGMAWAVVK
jgi:YVTN family beta-propeller protein